MIWTAILIACLISAPEECRAHEMIIQGNGIPTAAFIEAQFRAAEWLRDHPDMQQKSLKIVAGRGA